MTGGRGPNREVKPCGGEEPVSPRERSFQHDRGAGTLRTSARSDKVVWFSLSGASVPLPEDKRNHTDSRRPTPERDICGIWLLCFLVHAARKRLGAPPTRLASPSGARRPAGFGAHFRAACHARLLTLWSLFGLSPRARGVLLVSAGVAPSCSSPSSTSTQAFRQHISKRVVDPSVGWTDAFCSVSRSRFSLR